MYGCMVGAFLLSLLCIYKNFFSKNTLSIFLFNFDFHIVVLLSNKSCDYLQESCDYLQEIVGEISRGLLRVIFEIKL